MRESTAFNVGEGNGAQHNQGQFDADVVADLGIVAEAEGCGL